MISFFFLLIFGLIIIAIGAVLLSIRSGGRQRQLDVADNLSVHALGIFQPIRRTAREIIELVSQGPSDNMRAISGAATQEVNRIENQVAQALLAHDELRRALNGRVEAQSDLERLEAQVAADPTSDSNGGLQSAISARKSELGQYAIGQKAMDEIESGITMAQATLSELKAKLLSVKMGASNVDAGSTLRDSIERLNSFSVSVDEANEFLNHQS